MSTTREWYRNLTSGDRGYREGDEMFLDRVPPVQVTYNEGEWAKEPGPSAMTERQIGRIAFIADRELCRMLGDHAKARREWLSLGEEEQLHWSKNGPAAPELRRQLFASIIEALSGKACR